MNNITLRSPASLMKDLDDAYEKIKELNEQNEIFFQMTEDNEKLQTSMSNQIDELAGMIKQQQVCTKFQADQIRKYINLATDRAITILHLETMLDEREKSDE